jgi:hypothetical protein
MKANAINKVYVFEKDDNKIKKGKKDNIQPHNSYSPTFKNQIKIILKEICKG